MDHIWQYDRELSEILWEKDESFTLGIQKRYILKYTPISREKSISTDMDILEFFHILYLSRESRILETKESIIYTFEKSIIFFTDDTPRWSDDFTIVVKRDKYWLFRRDIFFYIRREVALCSDTFFSEVGLEDGTDDGMHDLSRWKLRKWLCGRLLEGSLFIFYPTKYGSDRIRSWRDVNTIICPAKSSRDSARENISDDRQTEKEK
jgi:hypothetical protein